jgi:hypothetical protein
VKVRLWCSYHVSHFWLIWKEFRVGGVEVYDELCEFRYGWLDLRSNLTFLPYAVSGTDFDETLH